MKEEIEEKRTSFRLQPFTQGPQAESISISGSLTRTFGSLLVEYIVTGPLKSIVRSARLPQPCRAHELWRHTCFELFFGKKGDPGYWEVNSCLSGRWNVYRFDDFRMGMREEYNVIPPQLRVIEGSDCLSLQCSLPINGIIDESCEIEAGVCGVIETTDENTHYFAIEHQGSKPDFHHRSSFVINLPALTSASPK